MKITDEMIKRNEKIKNELRNFCEQSDGINQDGSLHIGSMLYFLGFKIIEQEIKNEKLEERIDELERRLGGRKQDSIPDHDDPPPPPRAG